MKVCTKNIEDTKKLARAFAENIDKDGLFVSLFGDLGAGKTAFVRCLLKELDVKENITSPSFVILNEYKARIKNKTCIPVYHFDLYRLEKEGVDTIEDELREYSKNGVLTFVEWADFGSNSLPYDRLNVNVSYESSKLNEDLRSFEFFPIGKKYEKFLEKIKESL